MNQDVGRGGVGGMAGMDKDEGGGTNSEGR